MSQHVGSKNFFLERIAIYEQEVYGYLVSIVENAQIAEDLLQNIMARAWEKIGQLREPEKARGWLFSITRNEINRHYREKEQNCLYIEEVDELCDGQLEAARDKADVLEGLIKAFDIKSMRKALELLDGKYRRLIVMHYFQGLNQKEIAVILNQNHSTVRVNLVRALQKMRELKERIENGEFDDTDE